MKIICFALVALSVVAVCLTEEQQLNEEENSIFANDEPTDKNTETVPPTQKPILNTNQVKPPREVFVKFINDLFQIPITLIKTVSNFLSAGLENLTSGSTKNPKRN